MKPKQICVLLFLLGGLFCGTGWSQSPRVAILDSANTKLFFGLHYPSCSPPTSYTLGAEEYQRYFRGWEYVLQTNNIPYSFIFDADVSSGRLDQFDLLILSNTASLSDEEERVIDRWVRKGGRLLATFGSGYKSIETDPNQIDGLKLSKGGTSGLHDLWRDPLSKLFSTLAFTPGVDVQITSYSGPTANLAGVLSGGVLPYGAWANLLIQRPVDWNGSLGTLIVPGYSKPSPAILVNRAGQGLVIYFSFAPEYMVSKEFNLPANLPCPDGQNWAGRSTQLRILMRDSIQYLLNN
jgi:hypothetical protein